MVPCSRLPWTARWAHDAVTNAVTYRRAGVEDLEAICVLGQLLNAIHHGQHPDIYTEATTDAMRDASHWLPSLQGEKHAAFLAEEGQVAVGFITVQITTLNSPLLQPATIGRIGSVCVCENMHGQGIGRALMAQTERWARDQGATDIRLVVWAFNEGARHLYSELGYEVRTIEMGRSLLPAK